MGGGSFPGSFCKFVYFLCVHVCVAVFVCVHLLSCYYTLQDPLKQDQLKRLVYEGSYIIMGSALRVT